MIEDTPVVVQFYCPACEPDIDPITMLVSPQPCAQHFPTGGGPDDALVTPTYLSGSGEAGSDLGQRALCDLIHRGKFPEVETHDHV